MLKVEDRQDRFRRSAASGWLAQRARDSLLLEYEQEGLASPILTSHRLSDLGHGVEGVVNLSAGGQIHRQPPDFVKEAVRRAVDEGHFHYPGVRGDEDFRLALSEKLARENKIAADPATEILPTIGAEFALDGTMRVLVNPGDDVLLIEPDYACFEPLIRTYGGNAIPVLLRDTPDGWVFDPDDMRRRVTPRTKLFCFSCGNNPTGYLYTREDLEAIAEVAQEHDFFIFSDEEYEKLVFDGKPHRSIASLPGMAERTITAFSFSKAYSLSGMRIGYVVGPAKIMDHVYNVIRLSIQAVGSLSQRAAMAILKGPTDAWLREVVVDLERDRDFAVDRLNRMPNVRVHRPVGCYFFFARVEFGIPSWELAEYLLKEARISVISGHNFGRSGRNYLRISGCVGRQRLAEGLNRMEQALARLASP